MGLRTKNGWSLRMGSKKLGRYLSKVLPAGITLLVTAPESGHAVGRPFGTGFHAGSDRGTDRDTGCADRSTARCKRSLVAQYRYSRRTVTVRSPNVFGIPHVREESDAGNELYRPDAGVAGSFGVGTILRSAVVFDRVHHARRCRWGAN